MAGADKDMAQRLGKTRSLLLLESESIRDFLYMLPHVQLLWLQTCRFATLSI